MNLEETFYKYSKEYEIDCVCGKPIEVCIDEDCGVIECECGKVYQILINGEVEVIAWNDNTPISNFYPLSSEIEIECPFCSSRSIYANTSDFKDFKTQVCICENCTSSVDVSMDFTIDIELVDFTDMSEDGVLPTYTIIFLDTKTSMVEYIERIVGKVTKGMMIEIFKSTEIFANLDEHRKSKVLSIKTNEFPYDEDLLYNDFFYIAEGLRVVIDDKFAL